MTATEFPCVKYQKRQSHICDDCEIGKKDLCDVFISFVKKYLLSPRDAELEKEIAEKTVESIFRRFDRFRGRDRYMRGAFYSFCRQEFINRRNDVLRRKQTWFESRYIVLASQTSDDPDADDGDALVDNIASRESGQKRNKQFFPMVPGSDSQTDNILRVLEDMTVEKEPCAEIIMEWYNYLKRGLSQKEMADLKGIRSNTFDRRLARCIEKLKHSIREQVRSEE